MMAEFNPPLIACVVSEANFSFAALRSTRGAVIAIPAHRFAKQVVGVANCSGRNIDKFGRFGLTPLPARQVRPPMIKECFRNLECQVKDTRLVRRYNHIRGPESLDRLNAKRPNTLHHRGYGSFAVDGPTIRLKSAMR